MDLDVAVVGGGPAGISTALFLAAALPSAKGRIAVLEREAYPREKICAGAIGARADRALEAIGVRVACPSVAIRGFSVRAAHRTLAVRAPAEPVGRVVRRIEFDQSFADAARARGIRIEEGTRVTGLERRADGVELETSRGSIRAKLVVGADGVGSFVRRALGLPRGKLYAQVIEVDSLRAERDAARDLLHFDLEDQSLRGYAWDFPTLVGGEALVCRGLYSIEAEALGATERGRDLGERLEDRLEQIGARGGARKRKRFAERGLSLHEPTARPRVLLVGEAAGIDPVLGEGIAQAILYGAVAGPYLAACLERGAFGFEDWPTRLRRSRVGRDLMIRARALPFVYRSTRPWVERWVSSSPDLARAGLQYFAGLHVDRTSLARAALDLARAAIGAT